MNARHISALLWKQCKDTIKNKTILIQFLMFPCMALIMTYSVGNKFDLSPRYFIIMFTSMYITMAPILILSSIISEEKEKGSLRMMIMSNVKPLEYLTGMGCYVLIFTFLGVSVMGIAAQYQPSELLKFLAFSLCGILISIILGAILGMLAKNQTSASGLAAPVMLVCSFVPMLSMFNDSIKQIGQFLYSQQISDLLNGLSSSQSLTNPLFIIGLNFFLVLILYFVIYHKGTCFE